MAYAIPIVIELSQAVIFWLSVHVCTNPKQLYAIPIVIVLSILFSIQTWHIQISCKQALALFDVDKFTNNNLYILEPVLDIIVVVTQCFSFMVILWYLVLSETVDCAILDSGAF